MWKAGQNKKAALVSGFFVCVRLSEKSRLLGFFLRLEQ